LLIKIWVKNKFLTIFNEIYKIANFLQREVARGVEPVDSLSIRQKQSVVDHAHAL